MKSIYFEISEAIDAQLRAYCDRNGFKLSGVIRRAIRLYLDNEAAKAAAATQIERLPFFPFSANRIKDEN